ncbi:reverse transcriptase domain-containing protein [Tanacetum coccineum]
MRTHSSSNLFVESSTIPKRRNRRRSKQIVEPELRTIVETPVDTMADTRTVSELLQAPTEGYRDAIVLPAILAENFELKVMLLTLVTSRQFHGFERDDPHSHIRWFNKITSTLKYKNVPHDAIKLMLFPFSLEGAARIWLEKEPPRSIHTWEDLVSKFVNYFFPHSKTTNLKNDITNFQHSRRYFIYDDDDDDEESTIPLNEIISQIPPSIAITPVLPTMEPEDSLNMGDEHLSTIPEKESDKVIKSSVEDLVPIPRGNFMTFSNPLFDSNDDFTSSDDESFPDEDVQEENFKTYSNPLFEFDDKYISSDVNPLFNEVLEDIESKDSYVSNLDEQALLVTHLSELNEDECFDPGGDEIEACLTSDSIPPGIDGADFDPEGDILLLEKLLNDDISFSLPPKELHFEGLKVIKSYIPPDFEDDYYDSEETG